MCWNQIQVKSRGVIGIVKGWMGHIVRLVFVVGRTVVMVLLRGSLNSDAESGSIESDDVSALFNGIAWIGRRRRRRVKNNRTQTKDKDSMTPCPRPRLPPLVTFESV